MTRSGVIADRPTFAAHSAASLREEVRSGVGMPPRAMRFQAVRPDAPTQVLLLRDRFQMVGVDAMPYSAQVVKLQPFGDWADEVRVGPAMTEKMPITREPAVPVRGASTSPTPATADTLRHINSSRQGLVTAPGVDASRCHHHCIEVTEGRDVSEPLPSSSFPS